MEVEEAVRESRVQIAVRRRGLRLYYATPRDDEACDLQDHLTPREFANRYYTSLLRATRWSWEPLAPKTLIDKAGRPVRVSRLEGNILTGMLSRAKAARGTPAHLGNVVISCDTEWDVEDGPLYFGGLEIKPNRTLTLWGKAVSVTVEGDYIMGDGARLDYRGERSAVDLLGRLVR